MTLVESLRLSHWGYLNEDTYIWVDSEIEIPFLIWIFNGHTSMWCELLVIWDEDIDANKIFLPQHSVPQALETKAKKHIDETCFFAHKKPAWLRICK